MTEEPHVVADLRRQLRALPERQPRRRAPAVALALIVALAASVAGLALTSRNAPDAVAVEHRGNFVTVRLLDATAEPEKLIRELREQGIAARIRYRPAKPRDVGEFLSVTVGPPHGTWHLREVPDWMRHVTYTGREITFPAGVPVELSMIIGVPGG